MTRSRFPKTVFALASFGGFMYNPSPRSACVKSGASLRTSTFPEGILYRLHLLL